MSGADLADRDPDQVVTPEDAAPQLTALEDKIDLLTALGPDVVLVVPFDLRLAALTPEEFVTCVLLDAMGPRVCVVGHDFRFGTRASGDVDTLRALGCDRGRTVRADAAGFLAQSATPFDVIFLDPPFAAPVLPDICQRIEAGGWLKDGGFVYLESPAAAGEPVLPPGWTLLKSKRAGEVGYHLARRDVGERS